MSRVQCIDCGGAVVVDPAGFCPDGHHVGADGARIEAAIGVGVPYPDEPEPWVAEVKVDASVSAGAAARAPRPPSSPDVTSAPGTAGSPSAAVGPGGSGPAPGVVPASAPPASTPFGSPVSSSNGSHAGPDASQTDDLLRELHSLSDELAADSPPHVRVPSPTEIRQAPATPSGPPTSAAPTAATTPTDGAAHSDSLAELRALEAAVNALTSSEPEAPKVTPDDGVVTQLPAAGDRIHEAPDRDKLAEVEQLFAHRPRPLTEELPNQRPSQTGPPSESPPRPAFQRTPWSSLPVEEQGDGSGSLPSGPRTGGVGDLASPRGRRSASPAEPDAPLDLGNFTARGKRVGRAEAKRRKKGGR